jgi:AAA family ATP:ADP antiporter
VRAALFVLPIISFGGYAAIGLLGGLAVLRMAKTAENATDYSLMNTLKGILFLPTTREQKYKAKQAIDTFFVRSGDVLSAALVFAGTTWFALTTRQFAMINILLVSIWLLLAFLVGREHRRLVMQPGTHDYGKADGRSMT